uniref:Large ribosomal subunit protein bL32c n=1 Tax=Tmesipteris elongata TaxID=50272 RepID=A0A059U406_TMEEL|nr:ribosomal protein L32 [Tmesipteris elongata]AHZ58035.1 ribosomal protein L32 [Tmesipteris elongata]
MAVPKKRTSKSRKRIRKNVWKEKNDRIASRVSSLAQSILTGRSKSFYYAIRDKLPNSSE